MDTMADHSVRTPGDWSPCGCASWGVVVKATVRMLNPPEARILIDAGLSAREIERRLHQIDRSPAALDGVLISHEHSDHIHGVGALARRYKLPVYANPCNMAEGATRRGPGGRAARVLTGNPFMLEGSDG